MAAADKLDLFKVHKEEYAARTEPSLVELRKGRYLAVEGQGAPESQSFQNAVKTLYSVAFTMKMNHKSAGQDYKVCPLEGLWQGADGSCDFAGTPRETWQWTLLIRIPDFVRETDLDLAVARLIEKGKDVEVENVELQTLAEGRCVQMLHVGPFDQEAETLAEMARFAEAQGLTCHGVHHEIYLSDPRRVPPERLRTILRVPVHRAPS